MSINIFTHLLAVLGAIGKGQFTVDELAANLPMERGHVSASVGRLIASGLVERLETGLFCLSAKGRTFLVKGQMFEFGPANGQARQPAMNTIRQKCWKAMQVQRRFTIDDLLRSVSDKSRVPRGNLRVYLRALERSGHIALLPTRAPGSKHGSFSGKQWVLARDTGPIAPTAVAKLHATYDHNRKEAMPWRADRRAEGGGNATANLR